MKRKAQTRPEPPPRPLPLLAGAVDQKLQPMMEAVYSGTSVRGWVAAQAKQLVTWPKIAADPEMRAWFSRSRSTIHRDLERARGQLLTAFNGRDLDTLDLAAVVIDGTPVGSEQLVWAIGITRSGVKVPLGVESMKSESTADVKRFIERLHARGLITADVLWIADGHLGLRGGIQRATNGRAAIQLCRVHKQRNVLGKLNAAQREEHQAEICKRLQQAWELPSYDKAAAALEEVARWLEHDLGFEKAARSARHDIEQTLTLQALGIEDPELLRVLGTTNLIESANSGVSKVKQRKTTWREELGKSPRKATVAVAAARGETNWSPVVQEPTALAAVPLAVLRGRHLPGREWTTMAADGTIVVHELPGEAQHAYPAVRDLLAWADRVGKPIALNGLTFADEGVAEEIRPWLEQCGFADGLRPPRAYRGQGWARLGSIDFLMRPLAVPSQELAADAARALAHGTLGPSGAERATTKIVASGSPVLLARLGLPAGQLTIDQLATALTGRHAVDGAVVREGSPQAVQDANGQALDKKVRSVMSVAWELTVPSQVVDRWLLAGDEDRVRLEGALVEAAETGIHSVFGDDELAAALAVDRNGPDGSELRVRGVVLGVTRDGKLRSPWAEDVLARGDRLDEARAAAADLAAGVLDAELARMGPVAALAPPRGLDAPWTTEDYLTVLGEQRAAGLARRVQAYARDELTGRSLRELQAEAGVVPRPARETQPAQARERQDPFARLDRAGAVESLALERRIGELKETGGPGLDALGRRLKRLQDAGRHPNAWWQSDGLGAVHKLAVDHELAARFDAVREDVVDQLEPYRELLGDRRVHELAEGALRRVEEWATWTPARLAEHEAKVAAGMRRLDRGAARALHDVEHERAELQQRAAHDPAVTARQRQLDDAEQRLHLGRRHPDDWLAEHGAAAADRVAARALLAAHQRDVAREATPARVAEPVLEPRRPQPTGTPAGIGM